MSDVRTSPEPAATGTVPPPPRRPRTRPSSVLYDAPGPRARRTTLIASVVTVLLLVAAGYLWVYRPLDGKGQLSQEKWGPLVDPGNQYFQQVWNRVGTGFRATLTAAVLAIVCALVVGTLLALLRVQLRQLRLRRYPELSGPVARLLQGLTWLLNIVTRFCVEIFRGLPVVITIFFVARGLPEFGFDVDTLWYLVIGLTIYNSVVIAEILRSGMDGLPGGQREAAESIGLSPFQTTRMILLPQSFRIMLPALISQLVVVLKDTSLGFIIGYEELLSITKQVTQILHNPLQMYFAIGVIYIAVNYALSKLAQYVQRRLARGRRSAGVAQTAHTPAAVGAVRDEEN